MKLYTYFRSSCSYRVRIALGVKGLAWENAFVHLRRGEQRSAELLALNPQGLVPTLVDGDTVLGQSLAILEYLEERHPEPPLLPAGAAERARVRQLAALVACEIQPLQNQGVVELLRAEFGLSDPDVSRWIRIAIERGLAAVESLLDHSATGTCCHGEQPTLADVCLIPQVYNARRFGCDLSSFPTVRRIDEHCSGLVAFAQAAPEAQPDAES